MEAGNLTRRAFAAAAAGALVAAPPWAERLGIMCQLGSSEQSAQTCLEAAARAGFTRIQATFSWDRVNAAFLASLPGWIKSNGLQCQALGAYVNCLDPATILMSTRREDFDRAIGYAAEVGATRLVAWTGSFSPDLMKPDPRNQQPDSPDRIRRFLDPFWKRIEAARLHVALETYITLACPDAPALAALLKQLPSQAGAVLDPPNMTPPARFAERDQVMREMIAALGRRIQVVHLKDFRLRGAGGAYDLPGPLDGELNYRLFAKLLGPLPDDVPVIAEHLAPAQFATARRRLLEIF
ncbi:MAG: TIM barrel protein [Bryobacterales bacterium]|nr:TIM barrel protein [Bryobacterales bacterium]